MVKKILIDYSWINHKLSGGGLKSCENLHKIFTTKHFKLKFDCTYLIKNLKKNYLKIKILKQFMLQKIFI